MLLWSKLINKSDLSGHKDHWNVVSLCDFFLDLITVVCVGNYKDCIIKNLFLINSKNTHLVKSEDLSIICSNSGKESAPSSSKSASTNMFYRRTNKINWKFDSTIARPFLPESRILCRFLVVDSGFRSTVQSPVSDRWLLAYRHRQNLIGKTNRIQSKLS